MASKSEHSAGTSGEKEWVNGEDEDGRGGRERDKVGESSDKGGFVFRAKANTQGGGEQGNHYSSSQPRSRAIPISYRDKVLAPSYGGFLMKHSDEEDIVNGWKAYFNKIKATDVSMTNEDSEEEENHARRLEGKSAMLKFTVEEYTAWYRPWMNSLIIKVLGASFPTYVIRDRIHRMSQPRDSLKLIPLNNGYYIVSFSNKEDRDYAYQEGPWMIKDHYLIMQRWRPNFNPWKADLKRNIDVWIRLPDVPFKFYNVESLRRIGNMLGKIVKIDRSTSIYDKGGFARLWVEVDLQQLLLPAYTVFGEERLIVYEGLHQVCFTCGKYRHQKEECLMNRKEEEGPDETNKTSTEEAKTNRKASVSTGAPDSANGSIIMTDGGPSNNAHLETSGF